MIRRVIQRALLLMIRLYQLLVSPVIHALGGPGSGCRFYPTCSTYALEAIRDHGPIQGLWLSLRRIARCNPWGGQGFDPVPSGSDWSDTVENRIRK